jgi:hypothetical protein
LFLHNVDAHSSIDLLCCMKAVVLVHQHGAASGTTRPLGQLQHERGLSFDLGVVMCIRHLNRSPPQSSERQSVDTTAAAAK